MDHVSSRWLSNSAVEILTEFLHCNLQYVLSVTQVFDHTATNLHSLDALIMSFIYLLAAFINVTGRCPRLPHEKCFPWLGCFVSASGAQNFERHVTPAYLRMYCNLPLASKVTGPIIITKHAL